MKKHVFQVDQIHFLLKFCLKNPTHYSSISLLFCALEITERLFHQLTEYIMLRITVESFHDHSADFVKKNVKVLFLFILFILFGSFFEIRINYIFFM